MKLETKEFKPNLDKKHLKWVYSVMPPIWRINYKKLIKVIKEYKEALKKAIKENKTNAEINYFKSSIKCFQEYYQAAVNENI